MNITHRNQMAQETKKSPLLIILAIVSVAIVTVIIFLSSLSSHLRNAPIIHMQEFYTRVYLNQEFIGVLIKKDYSGIDSSGAMISIQSTDSIYFYDIDVKPNMSFFKNVCIKDTIIKNKGADSVTVISIYSGVSKKYLFVPFSGGSESAQ